MVLVANAHLGVQMSDLRLVVDDRPMDPQTPREWGLTWCGKPAKLQVRDTNLVWFDIEIVPLTVAELQCNCGFFRCSCERDENRKLVRPAPV